MAKVNWPSRKELDKMMKKLEKVEGTLHLNKDEATPLDKFRWELCQEILKYMQEHNLKQKELAKKVGVDEPEMSRILRHRIDKVSTDKLIKINLILNPKITLKVG